MANLKVLVMFDTIVDTDYGLFKIFKKEYSKNEYVKRELINSINDTNIFDFLNSRKEENLVNILLKEVYRNSSNKIYDEIMSTNYIKVLDESSVTNVNTLVNNYITSGLVDVTVLCKNKIEEQTIKSKIKNVDTITANDFSMIDISDFGSLFVKNIKDLIPFKKYLSGMQIYLSNYPFNFENDKNNKNMPLMSVMSQLGNSQFELDVVDVYTIDDKYKIKG